MTWFILYLLMIALTIAATIVFEDTLEEAVGLEISTSESGIHRAFLGAFWIIIIPFYSLIYGMRELKEHYDDKD